MIPFVVVCFAVLLLLGFPFWLVFLITSASALFIFTTVPMEVAAQPMFGALDNWVLIAVPCFIFAGEVMARSGMTRMLVDWIRMIIGGLPGGLPITTVAASEMFGAISGSSAAATAAIGKVLYPGLRETGYSEKFSLGLIVCCGPLATIIPPSITMILYATVTGASVGKLFLAGFIPGILIGVLLSGYVIWHSYRHHILQQIRPDWRLFGRRTIEALLPLGIPVLIFGGIYGGIFTPTEAAAVSTAYAVIVAILIMRELSGRALFDIATSSAQLTAKIFLIVAASGLFTWVLTAGRVPQALTASIEQAQLPAWVVLIIINVVLLIAGMFIDPTSATVVLTPLLWPAADAVGIDIIHFGIIITVNLGIGMFSPPFGLNLFVASSIFRVPMARIAAGVWPFFGAYLVALLVITYWSPLSLWLPDLIWK